MRQNDGIYIVILLLVTAPFFEAASAIRDADWQSMNGSGIAGTNYQVKCLAYKNGVLYMSGGFSRIGADTIRGLVRWNGGSFDSINHEGVTAMAVADDGTLFIGGKQDTAGKAPPYKVSKWNGTVWTNLGTGFDGVINDIEVDNTGNVYACGQFSTAGGTPASAIAKWDGQSWSTTGWSSSGIVKTLGIHKNGTIYAGGEFSGALAQLSGGKWLKLQKPLKKLTSNNPTYPVVNAMVFDSIGNLYAAGDFDSAGNLLSQRVAKWNGSDWEGYGTGIWSVMNDIAVDKNGILYTAGEGVIAKWDGKKWVRLGVFGGYQLSSTLECDDTGRLFVGGWFDSINQIDVHNFAIWNGATWTVPFPIMDGAVRTFASDKNGNLYAAGEFTLVNGVGVRHVAKWRDGKWSALGSGISDSNYTYNGAMVYALACDDSGRLYAGGGFSHAGGVTARNIARWNGAAWEAMGKGVNGTVYSLAHDKRGMLFAAGAFDSVGDFAVRGMGRWDGSDWYPAQAGEDGSIGVTAIGADNNGNVYAAGDFFDFDVWENSIALWKNDEWKIITGGMYHADQVYTLRCDRRGYLYAGGKFTSINGIASANIAKWNGSSWSALDLGIPGASSTVVMTIASDVNGNIYAGGGEFPAIKGDTVNNIAVWNGARWEALGSGVNSYIYAMECIDSTLYVGGAFKRAGKKESPYIARVNIHNRQSVPSVERAIRPGSAQPRHRIARSALFIDNGNPQDRVLLYSVTGRCLRESDGAKRIDLSGMSPQILIIRIVRDRKTLFSEKTFLE